MYFEVDGSATDTGPIAVGESITRPVNLTGQRHLSQHSGQWRRGS